MNEAEWHAFQKWAREENRLCGGDFSSVELIVKRVLETQIGWWM